VTSDVIPAFVEDTTFVALLAVLFQPGAPTSSQQPLVDDSFVLYAMTRPKRPLKMGAEDDATGHMLRRGWELRGAIGLDGKSDEELKNRRLSFAVDLVVLKGEMERR
jgi:hypothetical protein